MAAALYRGQGTAAAAIRPTTIKLDQEHSHQISTGGPPSYSHQQLSLGQCCKNIILQNVATSSLPLLTNCVRIDLNDDKSARKERFWKYLQATSVQRRPCLGAVMMSLCHTEASCPLSGSIVGSSYWIITPNFADNPFARIVQHTVHDKAGSGATPQYPD